MSETPERVSGSHQEFRRGGCSSRTELLFKEWLQGVGVHWLLRARQCPQAITLFPVSCSSLRLWALGQGWAGFVPFCTHAAPIVRDVLRGMANAFPSIAFAEMEPYFTALFPSFLPPFLRTISAPCNWKLGFQNQGSKAFRHIKILPVEKFFLPKEKRKPDTIKDSRHTLGAKYLIVTFPRGVWLRSTGRGLDVGGLKNPACLIPVTSPITPNISIK